MNNNPSILFINRVYPPVRGASGRMLNDLSKKFVRKGWDVTVLTSARQVDDRVIDGVRVIRVQGLEKPRGPLSYMLILIRLMIKAMRLKRASIIVTMSDPPLMVVGGYFASKFKKSNHINWCHDIYPDVLPAIGVKLPRFIAKSLKILRVRAMKKCSRVIVCGNDMARQLIRDGVDKSIVSVVYNWPDVELTDFDICDKQSSPYEIPSSDIVRPFDKQLKTKQRFRVLYSGNIGLAHPIETILEAAILLDKQDSDIEFVFVGDGNKFDYIAEQRVAYSLDNIKLLPYQPLSNMRKIMESGDVHLISMNDKASGLIVPCKIYSAMAVARPCIFIGPRSSEIAGIINDYCNGVLVAQGDAESLVQAVCNYKNDSLAWFNAHDGAIKAREVFTPAVAMDQWINHAHQTIAF